MKKHLCIIHRTMGDKPCPACRTKRTPLRKVSKKKAQEQAIYRRLKFAALFPGPLCEFPTPDFEFGCPNTATQVHHAKGQRGALLINKRYWWLLCMEHHRWVEDHKREARKMKLILY